MGNSLDDVPTFCDEQYIDFRKRVRLEYCQVYSPVKHFFRYYSQGDIHAPTIILIPPISSTPEVFYRQFLELPDRGYRLIAVHYSVVNSHDDWVEAFAAFMDYVEVDKAHLIGCGLSGLLIQHFATRFSSRVISMILVNSFCDSTPFKTFRIEYAFLPLIFLKDSLMTELTEVKSDQEILRSFKFVSDQLDQLTRDEVISRMDMIGTPLQVLTSPINSEDVTIITCLDIDNVPLSSQKKLLELYPKAHNALMKTGGDFPFFSRYEEFNLYITVHLRRYHDWKSVEKDSNKDIQTTVDNSLQNL